MLITGSPNSWAFNNRFSWADRGSSSACYSPAAGSPAFHLQLSFLSGTALSWGAPSPPRLHPLPKGNLHPVSDWHEVWKLRPLPQCGTCEKYPSFRALCRVQILHLPNLTLFLSPMSMGPWQHHLKLSGYILFRICFPDSPAFSLQGSGLSDPTHL